MFGDCTTIQPSFDHEEKIRIGSLVSHRGRSPILSRYDSYCERDISEAGDDAPDEVKNENIIKLSWALVHTRQPEDVQRGIALLEAPLRKDGLSQLQLRDMLYVHALGHYMSRDFTKCAKGLCRLMEIAPDCWQGWTLYNTVFYRVDLEKVLEGVIFYAATVIAPVIVSRQIDDLFTPITLMVLGAMPLPPPPPSLQHSYTPPARELLEHW
ncbi:mitochondrial fission 1 protein B-like [Papaver somniferum]|uniref:mitochondrial fission 1 protein B-like n=1 Tax=Papaver somniferum TaxID=3469 RepID=UPI000E6FE893|nr:mitochondrial fission 1 protein B-like [Papaver somniferum]